MELLHLAWHPVRSLLVTSSQHVGHDSKGHGDTVGPLQFWCTDANANWSAFAPDFQELEENVEYVEKEDEFDVQVRHSQRGRGERGGGMGGMEWGEQKSRKVQGGGRGNRR